VHLSHLFNRCISEGIFPDSLKVAVVVPIYKKGDLNKATNYRPIFLLSQFNKIFEKLLHSKFNLLNECQSGFRKKSSTILAISKIHDQLLKNIDDGLYSCCLYLDLSKAFYSVKHDVLLQKLQKYFGFRGNALNLIKSYLTNRYQYTKVGNSKSTMQNIDCGVPQRSSLYFSYYTSTISPWRPNSLLLYLLMTRI